MQNHLKSLELHGYKTFANETEFKLPGIVTAIVGPNGSGKSNIADSIRWVLGEQSYSLLRAKKTEDMIFSGSDQRSRAGLASVSITFDNEDNWLPIDYSEVVLTRRAYRDGQNEYLINNQRVRLKDFHELLARTGLGDRTYTIIGQGLVDVALAIRPDERRKLFEEAAGIGLYRERKEESLRRLDTTKRNLERVLDILSEIKPRLRSLERQAARINEYKRIQADLKENLKDWYGYHWFNAQQELLNVKARYDELEVQVDFLRMKQSENHLILEENRESIKKKQEALNSFHSQLSLHHSDLEAANLRMAILGEREHALTNLISDLEHNIIEANAGITTRKNETSTLDAETDTQQHELDELVEFQSQATALLKERIAARSLQESKIADIQSNLTKSEISAINLQAKIAELENRQNDFKANLFTGNQSLVDLSKKVQEDIVEQKEVEDSITQLQTELADQDKIIATVKNEINDVSNDIDNSSSLLDEMVKVRTRLSVKLDMIIQSEQALVDMSEGAKSLLKLGRNKKTPFEFDPINKAIVVPEKYEKAIAAALGDVIDLLKVKSTKLTLQLLEQIEKELQGRVAIIAEDASPLPKVDVVTNKNTSALGIAADLIDYPKEIAPVIMAILGNVMVVEGKKEAIALLKASPELQKIVTLNGEIFLNNGVVYLGKGESDSKLSLPRQKLDLNSEIDKLSNDIVLLSSQLKDKEAEKNAEEKALRTLQANRDMLEATLNDRKTQFSSKQFEVNKISNQIDFYQNQTETIKARVAESQSSQLQAEETLGQLSEQIKAFKAQLSEHTNLLSELPLSDFQAQVNKYDTDIAIFKEALKNKESRKKLLLERMNEQRNQLVDFEQKLTGSLHQVNEIREELEALREKVSGLNNKIIQIQLDNSGIIEQDLILLEQEQTKLQLVEVNLQKEILIKERQFSQARMDLALMNDKLDSLKEHIEDDFGMVNFEYSQNIVGSNPLPFNDLLIQSLTQKNSLPEKLNDNIKELKTQLRRMGAINPEAQKEYEEVKQRFVYLENQVEDLGKASNDLLKVIAELDEIMQRDFLKTFKLVNVEFSQYFTRLFNGGTAKLTISDESDPIASGIDIEAKLPGKREQGLALLSGGERSLAAVALIFALLKVSPTPFCILDEVDAMLDESNVGRFCDLLMELSESNQFILITHNRNTVQVADVIYGVTMGRDSTSQVLSLQIDQLDEKYLD